MRILITKRDGTEDYDAGEVDAVYAFGQTSGRWQNIRGVSWGVVQNTYPPPEPPRGVSVESGRIVCGGTVIVDGPCVLELPEDAPPHITWLEKRPAIGLTISHVPLYEGVVFSKTIAKQCGSNTPQGQFYLGRIRDPASVLCPDNIAELLEELARVRRRVALSSSGQSASSIPAAARRYADNLAAYREIEQFVCKMAPRRTVAEIEADLANLAPIRAVPRPEGRKPPADYAALRAELAEVEKTLQEPAPILARENAQRLAELEQTVPHVGNLPADIAAAVSRHLEGMKAQVSELEALRSARAANVGARKVLAARINAEGRRGVILAKLNGCGNPAAWDAYLRYKQSAAAEPRRQELLHELAEAVAGAEEAKKYATYVARREELFAQCMHAATAFGALTGSASTMDPLTLAASVSADLSRLVELEKSLADLKKKRVVKLQPFTSLLGTIPAGNERAREYIAMARLLGGAQCCFLPQLPTGELLRLLREYFPIIIVGEDGIGVNYSAEISTELRVPCECGASVRRSFMAKHLASAAHKKRTG